MAYKLNAQGWNRINALAGRYVCNDGLEINDASLQEAIYKLLDLSLPEADTAWVKKVHQVIFEAEHRPGM